MSASAASGQSTLPSQLSGLWGKSWTSLQGLASDLLGNDLSENKKDGRARSRRPFEATHSRTGIRSSASSWGPSDPVESRIGAGSREEREVLVRAKKREALLAADQHSFPDAVGKIKRRTSDADRAVSAPPAEYDDRDALVYLHHVRKQDTLAGLTIKYNCDAAALRKANRMWPNDTIQSRKTIILPVDICHVKGKRLSDEEAKNLFAEPPVGVVVDDDKTPIQSSGPVTNDWREYRRASSSDPTTTTPSLPASSPTLSAVAEEPPWIHDSWIVLDKQSTATEIARLPRRTLGYFPRARRKSQSYSDLDTPSTSIDLPRTTVSNISAPPLPTGPAKPSTRSRRPSETFAPFLHGPGGVGTFAKNVTRPGPAEDGLNKFVAQHLPGIAPRLGVEPPTPGSNIKTESQGSLGGLENVGSTIEGWVKKVASRAAPLIKSPTTQSKSSTAVVGNDLIELTDAFEIGDEGSPTISAVIDDETDYRGRSGLASGRSEHNANHVRGRLSRGASDVGVGGNKKDD